MCHWTIPGEKKSLLFTFLLASAAVAAAVAACVGEVKRKKNEFNKATNGRGIIFVCVQRPVEHSGTCPIFRFKRFWHFKDSTVCKIFLSNHRGHHLSNSNQPHPHQQWRKKTHSLLLLPARKVKKRINWNPHPLWCHRGYWYSSQVRVSESTLVLVCCNETAV